FVKKIDNELIVGFRDRLIQMNSFINDRYRRINLTDFKLSPEFVINNFKSVERAYKSGDVVYVEDFLESQSLISTKGNYFISFAIPEHNPKMQIGYDSDKKI